VNRFLSGDGRGRPGVATPVGNGEAEAAKYVDQHPGTIGYVSLLEARQGGFAPASATHFWAELQNRVGRRHVTYRDPSTNGDAGTIADANCKKTKYMNGSVPFLPVSTTEPWNEVTAALDQKSYPLCGLAYNASVPFFGAVSTFLAYVTSHAGQNSIANHDYYP
jgi:hypothetical protein